jgi:hypothetical protein
MLKTKSNKKQNNVKYVKQCYRITLLLKSDKNPNRALRVRSMRLPWLGPNYFPFSFRLMMEFTLPQRRLRGFHDGGVVAGGAAQANAFRSHTKLVNVGIDSN